MPQLYIPDGLPVATNCDGGDDTSSIIIASVQLFNCGDNPATAMSIADFPSINMTTGGLTHALNQQDSPIQTAASATPIGNLHGGIAPTWEFQVQKDPHGKIFARLEQGGDYQDIVGTQDEFIEYGDKIGQTKKTYGMNCRFLRFKNGRQSIIDSHWAPKVEFMMSGSAPYAAQGQAYCGIKLTALPYDEAGNRFIEYRKKTA
jgi:hypothetical protein